MTLQAHHVYILRFTNYQLWILVLGATNPFTYLWQKSLYFIYFLRYLSLIFLVTKPSCSQPPPKWLKWMSLDFCEWAHAALTKHDCICQLYPNKSLFNLVNYSILSRTNILYSVTSCTNSWFFYQQCCSVGFTAQCYSHTFHSILLFYWCFISHSVWYMN